MSEFALASEVGSGILPAVIGPSSSARSLGAFWADNRERVEATLLKAGGVLLRGFDVPTVEAFQFFAGDYGYPLLRYEFASTPRTAVSSGIYTSTEYPAHQHIPLHNEQSYTREWPMKIWFHCVTPAASGGETPIADSRAIYLDMPSALRQRFSEGLCYVRNYSSDFDLSWQEVFQTECRSEVEVYCRRAGIVCEWKDDGELRTLQRCQGIERHPVTGEHVWFNQAHLFHASNLQPEVRESLEDMLGADNLPRNVCFADGTPIDDSMLDEVREVLARHTVIFPWEAGDILMLDNMLTAHARTPFSGARKVVVAMAQPHGNLAPNGEARSAFS